VLDLSSEACKIAARLYADLRQMGELLPDADIFIAAIALANDCVVVTNNERHFQRISGLSVENWKTATP
jgi:tRNA(fMet)-specific endonuclease VapC